jgi:hypothetical protein
LVAAEWLSSVVTGRVPRKSRNRAAATSAAKTSRITLFCFKHRTHAALTEVPHDRVFAAV